MLKRAIAGFVVVLAACGGGGGGPVAGARRILDDDSRFETSYEAGDALAKVSSRLLAAGKRCDGGCDGLLSASAYAQVLAVRVLDCTAPGRFKVRAAMRAELDAIEDLDGNDRAPVPPPAPRCS